MRVTSVILLGQSHSGLQRHCGVLGMQTQPASSKHYSMPSSVLNKHARLRNEGFSIGWGSMSWCSKVKAGKRELMRKFSYWTTSQKTLYFYSWVWGKRGPRRSARLYFLYLLFWVLHIYNFHREICPLSLCYVILRNVNFQLNHILPIIIKL